jgi:outer membrane protein OmpA-like peptidoglycan-associated protein
MAKELHDCRDSLTGMDREEIWEHISYQQGLCSEIRFLDGELRGLRRQLAEAGGLKPEAMSAAAFAGLFDAGSAAQLRQVMEDLAGVQQSVRRLNRVYAGLLRRSRRSINVPIHTSRFASNWELSTSRATEMAKLFITKYEFPPERLSAAGFAEFHPVAPNDTAEGRALNRRVDIIVVEASKKQLSGLGSVEPINSPPSMFVKE